MVVWQGFATFLLMWSISSSSATASYKSSRQTAKSGQGKHDAPFRASTGKIGSSAQSRTIEICAPVRIIKFWPRTRPGQTPVWSHREGLSAGGCCLAENHRRKAGRKLESRNTAGQGVDVASGDWSQVPPCLVSREKLINKSKSVAWLGIWEWINGGVRYPCCAEWRTSCLFRNTRWCVCVC